MRFYFLLNPICVFTFSILTSLFAFSENRALILGGGGERDPEGQVWMFGSEVSNIASSLKNWNKRILFGSSSEHSVNKDDTLSYSNLENELRKLVDTSNENDQVLIYISTHGFPSTEKGHNDLSYPNSQTLAMADISSDSREYFSSHKIKKYIEQLQNKNVKVAVVNSSCYSGDSLNYFSDLKPFCLLSIAGSQSVGFRGGFSDIMTGTLANWRTKKVNWDPNMGDGKKNYLPLITNKDLESHSESVSLLELAGEAMKLDTKNLENSVLGFSLNSNGHFDHKLKKEGFVDFMNKMNDWLSINCKTKNNCSFKSQNLPQNCANINCKILTSKYNNLKEKIQKHEQMSNELKKSDRSFDELRTQFYNTIDKIIQINPDYEIIQNKCRIRSDNNECLSYLKKINIDQNTKEQFLASLKNVHDIFEHKLSLEKSLDEISQEIVLITNQIRGHALELNANENMFLKACHDFKL